MAHAHIFISYSRRDEKTISKLIKDLETRGFSIWRDREGLRGGEQWRKGIVQAIKEADAVLVSLSSNSAASDNVRTEVDLAKEGKRLVLPVLLEKSVPIPDELQYQLAGLQWIELAPDYKAGLDTLVETLGAHNIRRGRAKEALGTPRLMRIRGAIFGVAIALAAWVVLGNVFGTEPWWKAGEPSRGWLIAFGAAGLLLGALFKFRWRVLGGAVIGLLVGCLWASVPFVMPTSSSEKAVPLTAKNSEEGVAKTSASVEDTGEVADTDPGKNTDSDVKSNATETANATPPGPTVEAGPTISKHRREVWRMIGLSLFIGVAVGLLGAVGRKLRARIAGK